MNVSLVRLFFNKGTAFYILGSRKSLDMNLSGFCSQGPSACFTVLCKSNANEIRRNSFFVHCEFSGKFVNISERKCSVFFGRTKRIFVNGNENSGVRLFKLTKIQILVA